MSVTLLVLWKCLVTYRAARRCTISSLCVAVCGFQAVVAYCRVGPTRTSYGQALTGSDLVFNIMFYESKGFVCYCGNVFIIVSIRCEGDAEVFS